MMDDFNADNEKIEAALLGKVPMTVLHDETIEEACTTRVLDMDAEGWANHMIVLIRVFPTPTYNNSGLYFDIGSSSANASHRDLLTTQDTKRENLFYSHLDHSTTLALFPIKGSNRIHALAFDPSSLYYGTSEKGYHTEKMTLYSNFKGGERIQVLGIL